MQYPRQESFTSPVCSPGCCKPLRWDCPSSWLAAALSRLVAPRNVVGRDHNTALHVVLGAPRLFVFCENEVGRDRERLTSVSFEGWLGRRCRRRGHGWLMCGWVLLGVGVGARSGAVGCE
eukprot:2925167-Prymnesium_polylepis.1